MAERNITPEPIAASNQAFLVDFSSDLLTGHTFYFRVLYFDEAMRLRYSISPPFSGMLSIYGEAQDEFGDQNTIFRAEHMAYGSLRPD